MRATAAILATLLATCPARGQRLEAVSRAVHDGDSRPPPSNANDPRPRPVPSRSAPSASRGGWRVARSYLPYPYAMGYAGFDLPSSAGASDLRGTASVLTLDGGLALPNIGRMGLSVRALFGAVDIELRGTAFVEPLADRTDWAGLIGVRAGYNFNDGGPVRPRSFLGFASYLDRRGDASGVEAGFAVDAFPFRPLVVSVEFSGGVLGRSGLLAVRPSVGLIFGCTEVLAGWSHLWFFPLEGGPPVDLGGPLLGLRFWL